MPIPSMSGSTPSRAGLEYLAEALADIPRISCHAHHRRVDRLAVAFVPHGPGAPDSTTRRSNSTISACSPSPTAGVTTTETA